MGDVAARFGRGIRNASVGAAAVCAIVAGTGTAGAAPVYPVPPADPFYRAAADITHAPAGDALEVRRVPAPPGILDVEAWQVRFRSTDSTGHPIPAVTTVLAPVGKAPDGPLLSFQHVINALGTHCAPSQTLWTSDPDLAVREAPALNVVLRRGWTVAIPDHLGSNSAYGAARLGGQITLDGIRAVQQVPELQLAHSPVALAGYSGGGMATGWAAALAPTYAPDLKLVGAAMGGVPMNIRKMAEALGENPHPAFGLAFAAALGLEREYPERMRISADLTPAGVAMRDALADACTNDILARGAGGSLRQVSTNAHLADDADAVAVAEENSLELYPGVPTVPVFEWHSPTDALVPVDSIDATLDRYCAAGAPVRRVETPSPDHMSAAVLGLPDAFEFLGERFDGAPVTGTC
ncbi:lipase [Rhodococcus ruber]|nr:lipase family protein [Rhodococcus ruber]QDC15540.1 lipase [Rhodococcus ruber]